MKWNLFQCNDLLRWPMNSFLHSASSSLSKSLSCHEVSDANLDATFAKSFVTLDHFCFLFAKILTLRVGAIRCSCLQNSVHLTGRGHRTHVRCAWYLRYRLDAHLREVFSEHLFLRLLDQPTTLPMHLSTRHLILARHYHQLFQSSSLRALRSDKSTFVVFRDRCNIVKSFIEDDSIGALPGLCDQACDLPIWV